MGFQNIKAKKSLGQNFFINQNLARHIVDKVLETEPSTVIEIGPGKGFFTQIFVEKEKKVVCIEKDEVLAQKLSTFLPTVEVYPDDIFEVDLGEVLKDENSVVCFGSLPYNISKRIISSFLKIENIENYYFIVQKEVAEKYAKKGKSSILSLKTKIYADSKILLNISPHNFTPKPNVDSSLIHFHKNNKFREISNLESFEKYLHFAFKQPRKKLKNNIHKHYDVDRLKDGREKNFLNMRAEDMGLEEHLEIWKILD